MLRYQNFEILYIKVLFSDVVEHVLKHPDGRVAVVVAPVAGGLLGLRSHVRGVHAAEGEAALGLGADLVGEVQVDVRQVEDLGSLRALLQCRKMNENLQRY